LDYHTLHEKEDGAVHGTGRLHPASGPTADNETRFIPFNNKKLNNRHYPAPVPERRARKRNEHEKTP
jgi:hypothetical protein